VSPRRSGKARDGRNPTIVTRHGVACLASGDGAPIIAIAADVTTTGAPYPSYAKIDACGLAGFVVSRSMRFANGAICPARIE